MFTPVHTRRTFEEAVEQIAEAIRSGDLHPGDRLPSERLLAEQMAISRPTLREATRLLADSGVIEVRPGAGGGMFVATSTVPFDLI
jgi:GntR family transcriptional repressor for pyruvate dehydrogenase complex